MMSMLSLGPMMASSDAFQIKIRGKGGHGALPHNALDPMPLSFDIYHGIYKSLTRVIPFDKPFVLAIPKIIGSDAYNLIPHEVMMEGTFCTYDLDVRDEFTKQIESIVQHYTRGWGLCCEVKCYQPSFPPLINESSLVDRIFKAASHLKIPTEVANRTMVAEDFSFYFKKCPGAYLFLEVDTTEGYPIHHPGFNIESEEVLEREEDS